MHREPFEIAVPQAEVDDLRRRLERTRWAEVAHDQPDSPDGISQTHLRRLVDRWLDGYDWRRVERELNSLPQEMVGTADRRIHTVHVPSPRKDAVPLVLLHGWPSTFAEYRHVIGELTAPPNSSQPAFHVLAPSIPGFGFSPAPKAAANSGDLAESLHWAVQALGYERYLVHGSDLGQAVAEQMAQLHPDSVRGLHLHVGGVRLASLHAAQAPTTAAEEEALRRLRAFTDHSSAYATLNRTRPDTLAYALTDSPVGQLAWLGEKFLEWADPRHPVADDDILTAASIYWFTRTASSSARFYWAELRRAPSPGGQVVVPVAGIAFAHDIVPAVRRWAEQILPVAQWTESGAGGHFAALETPAVMLDSLRRFALYVRALTTVPIE